MVERFSYVVVGNGIAGITAVETLRAEDDVADIALIADNALPVYNRPLLKDFLAGRVAEDKLWLRSKSFYHDHEIRFFMERVINIETTQHNVLLQSGQKIGYHRLLLATGARARQLSCPGSHLTGVTTLRTVADYKKVLNYLGNVQRLVVVGSGSLAVECVEMLHHRGYQVTHLLRHCTLWPEMLDKTASDLVLRQEWQDGVDVHIEEDVAEIVGSNGHVTGIMTTKGVHIPCQMVVVAIGIEPVIDYIQDSGITCGQGVKIDGSMRTSVPDIYAAGDIAEITSALTGQTRVIGHWYPTLQQGRAAAYSMLDILGTSRLAHPFTGSMAYVNPVTTMFLYGLDFTTLGTTHRPQEGQGYQELVQWPQPTVYRKVLFREGVPIGMFSLGESIDAIAFKRAIDHRVNLLPVASQLFAHDFKLTDWLDWQKVPTPILAVSKIRNATRAKPMALSYIPVKKSQFIQIRSNSEAFDEQNERITTAVRPSINPYTLPIISMPRYEETIPINALLVPVLPATSAEENKIGKERESECLDTLWMEIPLSQTKVLTIGREPVAALHINHQDVSPRHAEITYANGYFLLRDLGSRSGTFLNNNRLEPHSIHILNHQDKIHFGTVIAYTLQIHPVNRTEEAVHYPKNG